MPTPYTHSAAIATSTLDRIIGSDEDQRSTKTYISNDRAALLLAAVANRAEGVVSTLKILRFREDMAAWVALKERIRVWKPEQGEQPALGSEPKPLDDKTICAEYMGARLWKGLHTHILEHGVSVDGFSLRVAADRLRQPPGLNPPIESSIQTEARRGV